VFGGGQISFREDGQGEWASEGVQLGGRGSAMGVIGMWTGAEHEPSDPLGACVRSSSSNTRLLPLLPLSSPPVCQVHFGRGRLARWRMLVLVPQWVGITAYTPPAAAAKVFLERVVMTMECKGGKKISVTSVMHYPAYALPRGHHAHCSESSLRSFASDVRFLNEDDQIYSRVDQSSLSKNISNLIYSSSSSYFIFWRSFVIPEC
jgi:hypothetical protein